MPSEPLLTNATEDAAITAFRESPTGGKHRRRHTPARATPVEAGDADGERTVSWGVSHRTHTDRDIDDAILERLSATRTTTTSGGDRPRPDSFLGSFVSKLDGVDVHLRERDADDGDFSVKYCTTAFCSLFLGSTGFGTMWFTAAVECIAHWHHARTLGVAVQSVYAAIGGLALVSYLVRVVLRPRHFWTVELREARQSSLLSSGAMGLALVPQAIHNTWPNAPVGLLSTVYYAGFALHVSLHLLFLACRVAQRRVETLEDVTPAWYVVGVGTAAYAAAANRDFASEGAMYAALTIGLVSLGWQLPLITYRLWKLPLKVDALPSVGVYMAPCALCTAAWYTVVDHNDACFMPVMCTLSAMAACCALVVFAHYRKMFFWAPPRPNWAAYTFPTVIFGVAMMYLSLAIRAKHPDLVALDTAIRVVAWTAIANATVAVNVVIIFGFIVGGRVLGALYIGVDRYNVRSSAQL